MNSEERVVLEKKPRSAASFYEDVRILSMIVMGIGALGLVGVGGDVLLNNAPCILASGAVLWLLSVLRPMIGKKKYRYTSVVHRSCGRVPPVSDFRYRFLVGAGAGRNSMPSRDSRPGDAR